MSSEPDRKSTPLSKRFNDRLFFLFHNLLVFKNIGPYLGVALLILQLLQLLILTLNGQNPYLKTYFFSYIIKDIDVVQLFPVVDRYFNTSARIVMNIVLLAFVVGISVSLTLLSQRKDYSKNVGLQNLAFFAGYFYEFTTKLLFVPIFGTFIITVKCDGDAVICFSGKENLNISSF